MDPSREIENALRTGRTDLDLSGVRLNVLPTQLFECDRLEWLDLSRSQITEIPSAIRRLRNLRYLRLSATLITELPDEICELSQLVLLDISSTRIEQLPESIGSLSELRELHLAHVRLHGLPLSFGRLENLTSCDLSGCELGPELTDASVIGLEGVRSYLRRVELEGVPINAAKMVLVGEGGVGKSALLAALRNEEWDPNRKRTHGIEIKRLRLHAVDADPNDDVTLHCWDFGGQPVYRQTHQVYFTAPAIYLVVWKPREGAEQNFVNYWIELIRRRTGGGQNVRILIVATHAEEDCLPRLDHSAIRQLHGDVVTSFHHVDSQSEAGIPELLNDLTETASAMPQIGRLYPRSWIDASHRLAELNRPYVTYPEFLATLADVGINAASAGQYALHAHQSGQILHYSDEPAMADVVALRPDWVSQAVSFVLEDKSTSDANGLIKHARLEYLWDNPARDDAERYPVTMHPLLLRLMERFDLSYRIWDDPSSEGNRSLLSLVGQLVPIEAPDCSEWEVGCPSGISEAHEALSLVDARTGAIASPDGLICQLIVRLHRFSLGRQDPLEARHWQTGMVLDDGHNGQALLRLEPGRVSVVVRAAYPHYFLRTIIGEMSWIVARSWRGMRATRQVACSDGCDSPGRGLFDVERLIRDREQNRTEFPCPSCDRWQNIDTLLMGSRRSPETDLGQVLVALRSGMADLSDEMRSRFDESVDTMLRSLDDQANDGPRLFTIRPIDANWRKPQLLKLKFRITLYCEHSRLPIHVLSGGATGVYEVELTRTWVQRVAPAAKVIARAVSLALPVARAGLVVDVGDAEWTNIQHEVDLATESMDALASVTYDLATASGERDVMPGSSLRRFHSWLSEHDPSFGGLEKVRDTQQRVLWVHPSYVNVYRPDMPVMRADGLS